MKKHFKSYFYCTTVAVISILVTFFLCRVQNASADAMNSSLYRIEYENINSGGKVQGSPGYKLSTTIGQVAAQRFSSLGYVVKTGFQYLPYITPFSFSISDTSIDLGTLQADTPSTAETTLTVSFQGAGHYIVTAVEDGPMETTSGAYSIEDTTCNGGGEACSKSSADVWTSSTAYGFGYNMTGDSIPNDFIDTTYFRPFPDSEKSEAPQIVMSSTSITDSSQAIVTFKALISNVQEAGTYQTVIRFTATPTF